jgi:hypothetical protein
VGVCGLFKAVDALTPRSHAPANPREMRKRHAHVMHMSCKRHAHVLHMSCKRHAHVMHMSCKRHAPRAAHVSAVAPLVGAADDFGFGRCSVDLGDIRLRQRLVGGHQQLKGLGGLRERLQAVGMDQAREQEVLLLHRSHAGFGSDLLPH